MLTPCAASRKGRELTRAEAAADGAMADGDCTGTDRLPALGFRRRTVSSEARISGALRRRAGAEAKATF